MRLKYSPPKLPGVSTVRLTEVCANFASAFILTRLPIGTFCLSKHSDGESFFAFCVFSLEIGIIFHPLANSMTNWLQAAAPSVVKYLNTLIFKYLNTVPGI